MRQKRAKTYRKLMNMYSMSFGFRQPYQVLVDSEMCKYAIDHKTDLAKQLSNVLQGEVKPMITQCCIYELYIQGKKQQPAVDLAKTFERRKCNHKDAISGDDCLLSVIGETNKHRYIIASDSQPLRVGLRTVPAVPLVHVNRTVIVLEPPSEATLKAKEQSEEQALRPNSTDLAVLAKSEVPKLSPPKRKKGPKGPNPLSVKKKKKVPTSATKLEKVEEQPDAVQQENVAAQGKRKHDAMDEDETEGLSRPGGPAKKRRRRRKKLATPVDPKDVQPPINTDSDN